MKNFNQFLEFISLPEIKNKVIFDSVKTIGNVSETQRTITGEEWDFIGKYVVKLNIAFLRQYHEWLCEQLNKED